MTAGIAILTPSVLAAIEPQGIIVLAIIVIVGVSRLINAAKNASKSPTRPEGRDSTQSRSGDVVSPEEELRNFLQGLSKPQQPVAPQPPPPPPVIIQQKPAHAHEHTQAEIDREARARAANQAASQAALKKRLQARYEAKAQAAQPPPPPPLVTVFTQDAAAPTADAYAVSVAASSPSPSIVTQVSHEKKVRPAIAAALADRTSLRNALILKEVLGQPIGLLSPADLMKIPRG